MVAGALTFAGCAAPETGAEQTHAAAEGTNASATTTRSTPGVPSRVPSSTPTVWTREQAAIQYLSIVEPLRTPTRAFNAALDAANEGNVDAKQFPAACRGLADAEDKALRRMDAGKWSEDLRPTVDDWMANLAGGNAWPRECGKSKTRADLEHMLDLYGPFPDSDPTAGTLMRVKLGLPPSGVQTTERKN